MEEEKNDLQQSIFSEWKRVLKVIMYIIIFISLILMIVISIEHFFIKPDREKYIYKNCLTGRLAYKIENSDERGSIELNKEIKEYGKENTYMIYIGTNNASFDLEINKDIYDKYVKDYNTITVSSSKLHIYIASSKDDFSKGKTRTIIKYSFPWENPQTAEFSQKEMKEAMDIVKKTKLDNKKWYNSKSLVKLQYVPTMEEDGYKGLCENTLFDLSDGSYKNKDVLKQGAIKFN